MALILPEGFNPDEKESPLENIYDHAFPLADKLSYFIKISYLTSLTNQRWIWLRMVR